MEKDREDWESYTAQRRRKEPGTRDVGSCYKMQTVRTSVSRMDQSWEQFDFNQVD